MTPAKASLKVNKAEVLLKIIKKDNSIFPKANQSLKLEIKLESVEQSNV